MKTFSILIVSLLAVSQSFASSQFLMFCGSYSEVSSLALRYTEHYHMERAASDVRGYSATQRALARFVTARATNMAYGYVTSAPFEGPESQSCIMAGTGTIANLVYEGDITIQEASIDMIVFY